MRRKKAALYDPYLDLLGGGERYVLLFMQELERLGYDITIFWPKDITPQIKDRLSIKFENLSFDTKTFLPETSSFVRMRETAKLDVFLYITDGSYVPSLAKKTFVYAMVPHRKLYDMSLLNRLKTANTTFITHSKFTQRILRSWGQEAKLLYPPIDSQFMQKDIKVEQKDNILLTVGRFFPHLHSKRHDVAIRLFRLLKKRNPAFQSYRLVLAGGLKDEDKEYFEQIRQLASADPDIELRPNISVSELLMLYKKAHYYIHCAGWEVDEQKNPEKVEHLGITPLEAMASRCIVLAYPRGGVTELVQDAQNGFLYGSEEEFVHKISESQRNPETEQNIVHNACSFIETHFSGSAYTRLVKELL